MEHPPASTSRGRSHPFAFRRYWLLVTMAGAAMMTTVDALLLQRARSFFTGGFLSVDHLDGAGPIAGFLAASLVTDASVIGLIAGPVMWLLARRRMRIGAVLVSGLFASVGPLIIADGISYQLLRYLGDAADLSLMLELAGGSVGELLAVASTHLIFPVSIAAAAIAGAGFLVWAIHRHASSDPLPPPRPRVLAAPALLGLCGMVVTTGVSVSDDVMENGLRRKPTGRMIGFLADRATDVDRDGFGIAARVSDPAPFEAAVFPYGVDQPGNGIDEDGVAGDLPAATPRYAEPPVPTTPWARRPDLVVFVLESFRADVVGAQHDGRAITPVLDQLAAAGVSSTRAYSHNGYTAQSRYHLLAGSVAGVRGNRTLIDDFNANGYTTAYFSGQDESFGAPEYRVGFDRAKVRYDARVEPERRYSTFTTSGSLAVPFTVVQQRVREFLERPPASDRPLFLYVNFHDTHFPYTHDHVDTLVSGERLPRRAIAPDERQALWATYVNTAANVDRAIGAVLADVRRVRGGEPAVIVTADHGESLFEEGFLGHGYALNEVQTRVPLIAVNLPLVITEPFGQADLRDAIDAALRRPPDQPASPRIVGGAPPVFQYLGTLRRQRQIAFLEPHGRTTYDFRSRRVQFAEQPWRRPEELSAAERDQFLGLIYRWEQMVLARRSAEGQPANSSETRENNPP